jgi:hypothetical protein
MLALSFGFYFGVVGHRALNQMAAANGSKLSVMLAEAFRSPSAEPRR